LVGFGVKPTERYLVSHVAVRGGALLIYSIKSQF